MFVISTFVYVISTKTRAVVDSDHQDYWLLACQHLISLPLQKSHAQRTCWLRPDALWIAVFVDTKCLHLWRGACGWVWKCTNYEYQIVRIAKSHHIVSPNDHYKIVSLYHNVSYCIKVLHAWIQVWPTCWRYLPEAAPICSYCGSLSCPASCCPVVNAWASGAWQ